MTPKKFLRKLYRNHSSSTSKRTAASGCSSMGKSDYENRQQNEKVHESKLSGKIKLKKGLQTQAFLAKLDSTGSSSACSSPKNSEKSEKTKFSPGTSSNSRIQPCTSLEANLTSTKTDKNGISATSLAQEKSKNTHTTQLALANGNLPKDHQAEVSNDFPTPDDAYLHLKQELNNIRARDVVILKRFQRLEQDLQGVKQPLGPSPIVELPPNLENAFSLTYTTDRLLVNGDLNFL